MIPTVNRRKEIIKRSVEINEIIKQEQWSQWNTNLETQTLKDAQHHYSLKKWKFKTLMNTTKQFRMVNWKSLTISKIDKDVEDSYTQNGNVNQNSLQLLVSENVTHTLNIWPGHFAPRERKAYLYTETCTSQGCS